jgi:hypothetical protein
MTVVYRMDIVVRVAEGTQLQESHFAHFRGLPGLLEVG